MQEKPNLSKAQGANTPDEVKHMRRVPYDSAIGSIMNIKDMVLVYGGNHENELRVTCYIDKSAKQSIIAMYFKETEYIVAAEASLEVVWMTKFIDGLGKVVSTDKEPIEMLCDNTSAIAIANDPKIIKGARHYQRKYHFIREVIKIGNIVLNKVHTDDNVVNLFTKPMSLTKHNEHALGIGLRRASSPM
ncbi:hypothetical protein Tco_1062247 [Tanacetum coccineum]